MCPRGGKRKRKGKISMAVVDECTRLWGDGQQLLIMAIMASFINQ
jgi:hypothetical protein